MPKFRSLTHFPQQFFVGGMTYLLNPGEIKEFPEVFIGRYNGLIEHIVEKEEVAEILLNETDEEIDDIADIVKKADDEVRKDVLITPDSSVAIKFESKDDVSVELVKQVNKQVKKSSDNKKKKDK